jgi:hypothetical protein
MMFLSWIPASGLSNVLAQARGTNEPAQDKQEREIPRCLKPMVGPGEAHAPSEGNSAWTRYKRNAHTAGKNLLGSVLGWNRARASANTITPIAKPAIVLLWRPEMRR